MEDLQTRLRTLENELLKYVRSLVITIDDGKCTVDGVSQSFYHKQLVTRATMQALPKHRLNNQVVVT